MLTIKTWRDPYDSGFSPTRPREIEFEPGLTVLVGCNGAGKTTLIKNTEDEVKRQKIPCHLHDNLKDGGFSSINEAIYYGDIGLGASLWCSSEGEAIKLNFGKLSTKFRGFLQDGFFDTQRNRLKNSFKEQDKEEEDCKKRVLLFDAVDSGLSVDSIIEIKTVFELILKDANELGIEMYLIISANEYELARGSRCFDVNSGKYIEFDNYEEYRTFILKNRDKKEKRIEKQTIFFEKKKKKEEEKKKKYEALIEKIETKAEKENRRLTPSERFKIDEYKRIIKYGEHY